GHKTYIVDPGELSHDGPRLMYGDQPIDLVYNRLVDFGLSAPEHRSLLTAWETGSAVVTPNPALHALYAAKRTLIVLSDSARLRAWGLPIEACYLLEQAVPRTRLASPENADELWRSRKGLFFKPVAGHGSKGVYRGSKLTRGTFDKIISDNYVAQTYV